MDELVSIIVPLGICVALPCCILGIVFWFLNNRVNKNAEIAIKAIESNSAIDVDKLVAAMAKPEKTPQQLLNLRLLRGCILSLVGIAFGIFAASISYHFDDAPTAYFSLLISCIFLAIGIAYLIVYFVTRKSIEKETTDDAE